MKPVDQEFLHKPEEGSVGDCLRACLASVLELPIADVPHFAKLYPTAPECWCEVFDWLEDRGHEYVYVGLINLDRDRFYIASGPSPRSGRHAVVCKGSEVIHDPHPSKSGLTGSKATWVFAELQKQN